MTTRTVTIELNEDLAARLEAREGTTLAQKVQSFIAESMAGDVFEADDEAGLIGKLSPAQIASLEQDAQAALAGGMASSEDVAKVYAKFGVKWTA